MALRTVKGTARELECSERTVWKLISTGELESVLIGGLRRVPDDSLKKLIEQGRRRAGGDVA